MVDLTWSGATATVVRILRGGDTLVSSAPNNGRYTDSINAKGGGSYKYKGLQ